MINCAIAGLGRWGRSLVNAAEGLDQLKVSRAVETDLDRARTFCAEHGIELSGDFDSILADPAIDAVLLATPHTLHREQVIAAAAAKKQVFCEKPLALRQSHAKEMFDACRAANVVLGVGHNRR
jgi:predicted dehydrogenase